MQGFEFIAGGQVRPFRYFSQKVLPTVYDDSLSYLELLQKMELYLNEVITAVNANSNATTELQGLYTQFTQTVNGLYDSFTADVNTQLDTFRDYFNNLDVQTEIDNKLDALVADGTMSSLILPIVQAEVGDDIGAVVDAWLVAHPEATTTVQDGAVTTAKLANDAVTIAKLGADVDALLTSKAYSDSYSPLLTSGVAESLLSGDEQQATFAMRESAGASVGVHAILGNTEVVGSDLVSVNIEGIKTTGKNLALTPVFVNGRIILACPIPIGSQSIISFTPTATRTYTLYLHQPDSTYITGVSIAGTSGIRAVIPISAQTVEIGRIACYTDSGLDDITEFQIQVGNVATPYEPYQLVSERAIDVATYFPDGMRGAGTAHDELRRDKAIMRIGAVDLGTLDWSSISTPESNIFRTDLNLFPAASTVKYPPNNATVANAIIPGYEIKAYGPILSTDNMHFAISEADAHRLVIIDTRYSRADSFANAISGVYMYYELATPTETAINPPINMDYLTEQGGTEQIIIPTGDQSTAPTFVYVQGYDADGVVDKVLSVIAPLEGAKASTNYAIGSVFAHDGKLYKATSAIATGETIRPGTNCALTTVMAEIAALA